MPKICYVPRKFKGDALAMITHANKICEEYADQGYELTLRQLYYQFVARGLIANKLQEYKRLGSIVSDARMAGLIDWLHVEDRTRGVDTPAAWDDPAHIVGAVAKGYAIDKWEDQPYRVEVWVEKEALAGVVAAACQPLQVPYLSCRGYTSVSEMWRAGGRLLRWGRQNYTPYIIHLGDHDPSGIDMSRDIQDRLAIFTGDEIKFNRIALNMDQVERYSPPPNPAKTTDSRFEAYIAEYGPESWELDALDPRTLHELITDTVLAVRDEDLWEEAVEREEEERKVLEAVSDRWNDVQKFLTKPKGRK